ncbi:MAG: hypothetical protein ACI8ZO_000108 [Flavobacteriales bacterium]|jgi:hypothetical protein
MKQLYFIILCLATLIFNDVKACSCIGLASAKSALKSSEMVFVGKAISKEIVQVLDLELTELYPLDSARFHEFPYTTHVAKYKFQIKKLYKGFTQSDTLIVFTGVGGGDCGYSFNIGVDYIVYSKDENNLTYHNDSYTWTSICSRTRVFDITEITLIKEALK